jgi:hypothetical protein
LIKTEYIKKKLDGVQSELSNLDGKIVNEGISKGDNNSVMLLTRAINTLDTIANLPETAEVFPE